MPTTGDVLLGSEQYAPKEPRSYRVAVRTKHDKLEWSYNGLRFGSKFEAAAWATALEHRWADIIEHRIEPSDDVPNCAYPVPSDRYNVKRG